MRKYHSITMRIFSIIILTAFIFTQAALGYEARGASNHAVNLRQPTTEGNSIGDIENELKAGALSEGPSIADAGGGRLASMARIAVRDSKIFSAAVVAEDIKKLTEDLKVYSRPGNLDINKCGTAYRYLTGHFANRKNFHYGEIRNAFLDLMPVLTSHLRHEDISLRAYAKTAVQEIRRNQSFAGDPEIQKTLEEAEQLVLAAAAARTIQAMAAGNLQGAELEAELEKIRPMLQSLQAKDPKRRWIAQKWFLEVILASNLTLLEQEPAVEKFFTDVMLRPILINLQRRGENSYICSHAIKNLENIARDEYFLRIPHIRKLLIEAIPYLISHVKKYQEGDAYARSIVEKIAESPLRSQLKRIRSLIADVQNGSLSKRYIAQKVLTVIIATDSLIKVPRIQRALKAAIKPLIANLKHEDSYVCWGAGNVLEAILAANKKYKRMKIKQDAAWQITKTLSGKRVVDMEHRDFRVRFFALKALMAMTIINKTFIGKDVGIRQALAPLYPALETILLDKDEHPSLHWGAKILQKALNEKGISAKALGQEEIIIRVSTQYVKSENFAECLKGLKYLQDAIIKKGNFSRTPTMVKVWRGIVIPILTDIIKDEGRGPVLRRIAQEILRDIAGHEYLVQDAGIQNALRNTEPSLRNNARNTDIPLRTTALTTLNAIYGMPVPVQLNKAGQEGSGQQQKLVSLPSEYLIDGLQSLNIIDCWRAQRDIANLAIKNRDGDGESISEEIQETLRRAVLPSIANLRHEDVRIRSLAGQALTAILGNTFLAQDRGMRKVLPEAIRLLGECLEYIGARLSAQKALSTFFITDKHVKDFSGIENIRRNLALSLAQDAQDSDPKIKEEVKGILDKLSKKKKSSTKKEFLNQLSLLDVTRRADAAGRSILVITDDIDGSVNKAIERILGEELNEKDKYNLLSVNASTGIGQMDDILTTAQKADRIIVHVQSSDLRRTINLLLNDQGIEVAQLNLTDIEQNRWSEEIKTYL